MKLVRLPGPATQVTSSPSACVACGDKHLYKQNDFNRGLGLALIVVASLATIFLEYLDLDNWWLVWTPMFVILVVDRSFAYLSPLVVICYKCGHLHRGLDKAVIEKDFAAFDLDLNDRIHYADRVQDSSATP